MDETISTRHVQRLSDDLVNKIAAGEVVERPASVVKELIENALDAGARQIAVEIQGGGRTFLRVRDDGCGMSREDARLAIERHATSKLRTLEDLASVATHGFRGEALPSIASVAHLVLSTCDESSPAGTEVEVQFGRLVHVRDTGHPRGTTVEVRDLFGAVPARRKFLRADSTEAGHVAEVVTLAALAHPQVGFGLTTTARTLITAPPTTGLGPRIYQLFGGRLLSSLTAVDGGADWVHVTGLISRPDQPQPARASIRLFVNGRPVRDRALSKAVLDACRKAGVSDPRPEAFLFIETPLAMVDVNVHPAKTEVRFADARVAWAAMEGAVRQALSTGARQSAPLADTTRVSATVERAAGDAAGSERISFGRSAQPDLLVRETAPTPYAAPSNAAQLREEPAGQLAVLGQHRLTYIVASDGEELVLIDQHTAHERVRFEALLARMATHSVESQLLLAPAVVPLAPRLLPLVETHAALLSDLGFDVEGFGGGSVRLRAVPAVLGTRKPDEALEGILRDLIEREGTDWLVSGDRERLAATVACHSAARAGDALTREAMSAILRDLTKTQHPTLCPHGRPTVVRIPRDDVSRWFGRKGWRRE